MRGVREADGGARALENTTRCGATLVIIACTSRGSPLRVLKGHDTLRSYRRNLRGYTSYVDAYICTYTYVEIRTCVFVSYNSSPFEAKGLPTMGDFSGQMGHLNM